jgi:hypothetical protein
MTTARRSLALAMAVVLALPLSLTAQPATPLFKAEELDQLAAPIALYPDPLLAQVLMASTYPLEVVQAARFVKENPSLTGAQLDQALQGQSWDDSVKSLVTFPQVLAMMDAKLDWTQKLGDAFLAQQKELMDAVQNLRARAQASGNLKSTAEQTVTVEPAPAPPPSAPPPPPVPAQPPQQLIVQQAPPQIITIVPANPQVVYVPTYNPTVIYGAWPYPAYPPYYYYPPGYVAGAAFFSFAAGVAVGSALWGNCNWRGGNVNINVNQYNNYTRNVNNVNVANRRSEFQGNRQDWQHSPEHRGGAQYRDAATQQRFKPTNTQAAQARESFRGRAEQGRQDIARGGADQFRAGGAAGRQPSAQPRPAGPGGGGPMAQRPSQPQQSGQARGGAADRQPSAESRPAAPGGGPGAQRPAQPQQSGQARGAGSGGASAFQGVGQGRQVQDSSNRGQASRQSMGTQRGASAPSGPAGGGGASGARGGGGGRR